MSGINMSSFTYVNPQNPGGAVWKAVDARDFTDDGQPDILFENSNTGEIVAWTMNGVAMTRFDFLNPSGNGSPNWQVIR